jgi:hypothetical protein
MFDRCYRCGEPGHTRRNCPTLKNSPPAPDSVRPVSWKPQPPSSPPHQYPADHYLHYECPHCKRPPLIRCWNNGTGKERPPHSSRIDLVQALTATT